MCTNNENMALKTAFAKDQIKLESKSCWVVVCVINTKKGCNNPC